MPTEESELIQYYVSDKWMIINGIGINVKLRLIKTKVSVLQFQVDIIVYSQLTIVNNKYHQQMVLSY